MQGCISLPRKADRAHGRVHAGRRQWRVLSGHALVHSEKQDISTGVMTADGSGNYAVTLDGNFDGESATGLSGTGTLPWPPQGVAFRETG